MGFCHKNKLFVTKTSFSWQMFPCLLHVWYFCIAKQKQNDNDYP